VLWSGFLVCFDVVSSLAGRRPEAAIANGLDVVNGERALLHGLPEVIVQRAVDSSHALTTATVLTYRTSEFVVLSLALVWVYLRRHDAFARFRNTILVTNVAALVVYFALPSAPPRMFPEFGFVDTIARAGGPSRDQGPLAWAANPYAAMPSLHSADALIVGVGLALLVRRPVLKALWLLWPVWVWFSVVATGNHFVMDVVAGVGLAVLNASPPKSTRSTFSASIPSTIRFKVAIISAWRAFWPSGFTWSPYGPKWQSEKIPIFMPPPRLPGVQRGPPAAAPC
jgi:membrane-associated phospholipid phosphatase